MKRCAWLLLLLLPAVPAASDDKKKDDKKGKEAAQAVVVDPVKDAEAKLAAGDVDGAIKALERCAGDERRRRAEARPAAREPRRARRRGRRLQGRVGDTQRPAKGEALGRMAVAQDDRGMARRARPPRRPIAADPEGVWPTIAMARRRSNEGKPDEAIALAQKAVGAGGRSAPRPRRSRARRSRRATWRLRRRPTSRRSRPTPKSLSAHDRARDGAAQDRPRRRGGADAREGDRGARRARWRRTRRWRGSRSRRTARRMRWPTPTSPRRCRRTTPTRRSS